RQRPVFAGDRDFSTYDKTFHYKERTESVGGSTATPAGRINARSIDVTGNGTPGGKDLCGPRATFQYCKPDGHGGYVPFVTPDDLYNYQPENYLDTPSQRYNVFGAGHYDLRKDVHVFFEGLYLNRQSDQRLAPEPFTAATPISSRSIYNNTGGDIYDYNRRLVEFGPRKQFQNVDTFRLVTGIGGKIDADAPALENWKWELSYNYGHVTGLERDQGNLIKSRLGTALGPSFVDANGIPRCGTPGKVIPECVPMNIMGPPGSIASDQAAYVTFTGVNTGFNDQKTALAQASGRLVKLPNSGDISLAVGADYRREAGGFTPDPLTSTGDTTGNMEAPTGGSYNVAEAFAELSVVPVAGLAAARWVELNLAGRAFRYNTFGTGATWKAGALFKTIGGVAVRGTYSTAFRAPSVLELYAGRASGFATATDPCDTSNGPLTDPVTIKRCAEQRVPTDAAFATSQQREVGGGNPDLQAETAKVFTAGLVYEPPQVKGLSFTADYFNVKIKQAIQALGAQIILDNCYTRDRDEDCAKIHRAPQRSYAIDYIDDALTNAGGTETDGIDFVVVYAHEAGKPGRFRHRLEGQYLRNYLFDNGVEKLQGVGFYDLGVYPKLKANFSTLWERKGVSAGFNLRYIAGYLQCQNNNCNTPENREMFSRDVAAYVAADLFAGYMVKSRAGTTGLTVGVNNLTDQKPPLIYQGTANSDPSAYDYLGRYFYARMSQSF
ncbi:MAG TPA: TonB-dependent receptor, partial [Kofleriaceae bacterium]|nr:TonB-dependent receptor [Kofleriaceae bacterium]